MFQVFSAAAYSLVCSFSRRAAQVARLFFLVALMCGLATLAEAQDEKPIKYEINGSVFVVTNNGSVVASPFRKDNIGLGVGGTATLFEYIQVGGDVFGDHTNNVGGPARTRLRANAAFSPYKRGFARFWIGAEGFKFGNETGGAGLAAVSLWDFIKLTGAYGQDDYTLGEVEARLLRTEYLDAGIFYRAHKMDIQGVQDRGQYAGLRFYLHPGK